MGTFLFVLGVLTVLGTSFAIGVSAGRRWPGLLPSLGVATRVDASGATTTSDRPPTSRPGLAAPAPRSPVAPVLTFYRELTAPLAAPPSPLRPERSERSAKSNKALEAIRPEAPSPVETRGPAAAALPDRRFTIQVGAFKTREQAETMRVTLSEVGHDAYVAALDVAAGARFRVRVGTFATRDEARQAADRLGHERQLATYVTIR
ncbi:MAG: SPOR domain-containing protein [Candidatus Rokuibacteriota bacterium]